MQSEGSILRRALRGLMMLDPGYRKASFVEQRLDKRCDELLTAIAAARPADRTDELKAAIEAAKPADRTDELKAAIEAAKPADRIDELLTAIAAAVNSGHEERVTAVENIAKRLDQLETADTQNISAATTQLLSRMQEFNQHRREEWQSLFRNDIRCRWQVIDALEPILIPPGTLAKCPICGHEAPKESYKTKVTECIFGGGRLERYVCPDCDCIFGPLKMMRLSEQQLGEEYKQSYTVYSESDCTMLEKRAFESLNPHKDGVYLNYGAGAWNKTTKELRESGFDVYDFEPYAPAETNPWVIRSFDELSKKRFDGIFSNDVIEHFRNPIEDLKRLAGLLKLGGMMVHCSGCYEYAFEYTRFHLAFFTGRSLGRMAAAASLNFKLGERLCETLPARLCCFTWNASRCSALEFSVKDPRVVGLYDTEDWGAWAGNTIEISSQLPDQVRGRTIRARVGIGGYQKTGERQSTDVFVGGKLIATIQLSNLSPKEYEFVIAKHDTAQESFCLTFKAHNIHCPKKEGLGADPRELGLSFSGMTLEVVNADETCDKETTR